MDGDDEDIGWDGPNIRPPPVKQDSGSRSRYSSDRNRKHRAHNRPTSGSGAHSKPQSRGSSHQDSRGNPSRGPARDNHRRGPVEDLRGRIGQSKISGKEHRHRQGRDSDRSRSQRVCPIIYYCPFKSG